MIDTDSSESPSADFPISEPFQNTWRSRSATGSAELPIAATSRSASAGTVTLKLEVAPLAMVGRAVRADPSAPRAAAVTGPKALVTVHATGDATPVGTRTVWVPGVTVTPCAWAVRV